MTLSDHLSRQKEHGRIVSWFAWLSSPDGAIIVKKRTGENTEYYLELERDAAKEYVRREADRHNQI